MNLSLRKAMAVALLAVFAALGTGCQPHQFKATVLQPAKAIDDFSLPASDGSTFTLSDHKDRFVILYFGYTNCPDVCPATLAQLQQMTQKLGPDASKVEVAFVTVDPERDTLDVLKAYLSHFNPAFVGLRPTDDSQITGLTKQFGIYYELATPDAMTMQYEVNHTSSVMVLNQMGLKAIFGSDISGADMAADLQEIMKGN
jgi:protein SCO1